MNLLTKLIYPRKDCKAFSFEGRDNLFISSNLSRSIDQPSFEITCPRTFPSPISKIDFFVFKEIPYLLHLIKAYSRCHT